MASSMSTPSHKTRIFCKKLGELAPPPEQVLLVPRGLLLLVVADIAESEVSFGEDDEFVWRGAGSEHTSLKDPLLRADPWQPLLSRSDVHCRTSDIMEWREHLRVTSCRVVVNAVVGASCCREAWR
eukprot:5208661-Amphidinium_carterae.1